MGQQHGLPMPNEGGRVGMQQAPMTAQGGKRGRRTQRNNNMMTMSHDFQNAGTQNNLVGVSAQFTNMKDIRTGPQF